MYEICHATSFDAHVILWASESTRHLCERSKARLVDNAVASLRKKRDYYLPFNANGVSGRRATNADRAAVHAIDELLLSVKASVANVDAGAPV